jgi:DNA-binding NtrC family response regulator
MKHLGNILIVDDNRDILTSTRLLLKQHYQLVETLDDPTQIEQKLKQAPFDVVLLDMNFTRDAISGKEGFFWLEKILAIDESIVVIMMTAYAEISLVVDAIKSGASDFISKPCKNDQLLASLAAAFKFSEAKRAVKQLTRTTRGLSDVLNDSSHQFLGKSRAMQKVFSTIEKVAHTDANVLILGESGTGKELTARAIHNASQRARGAFISVDMGTVTESLFESELFGHKKGAFTDARADRVGRFELAKGGSLFLDELGNLPVSQQVKLLAALQNEQITPVGENNPITTDIRLISATNEDLDSAISDNRFRQDLLYRINTIEIQLPPLRDRPEDIPLLVDYYLDYYNKKYRRAVTVEASQYELLKKYSWPGNVRELSHVIERAVILAEGSALDISAIAKQTSAVSTSTSDGPLLGSNFNLNQVEHTTIQNALTFYEGNVSQAAKALGLTRGALYRRLDKYDL